MIEITTKDGSEYTIDPWLIACISRKTWKNLDANKQDICTISWMGGGQLQVDGSNYKELIQLWYRSRAEGAEDGKTK